MGTLSCVEEAVTGCDYVGDISVLPVVDIKLGNIRYFLLPASYAPEAKLQKGAAVTVVNRDGSIVGIRRQMDEESLIRLIPSVSMPYDGFAQIPINDGEKNFNVYVTPLRGRILISERELPLNVLARELNKPETRLAVHTQDTKPHYD